MTVRACVECGRPSIPGGNRCVGHYTPEVRNTYAYQKARAIVRHQATTCWICGQPFTPANPPTADHVIPVAAGGNSLLSNLRAAHLSCNARRGVGNFGNTA
jgi:5-methylcytosine-specific restriction endonuclease McrA